MIDIYGDRAARDLSRCVAESSRFYIKRRRCAAPGPASAPGSALEGPPAARRAAASGYADYGGSYGRRLVRAEPSFRPALACPVSACAAVKIGLPLGITGFFKPP